MHSHPRARPLFVDRSPPPPHPCRCQGPCCSATRRSASLPPYSPPSHGAPQAGTPLSLPATTVVRGTERRRRPLLSTPRSLARITHKARRLHPCPLVRAWSSENHLSCQISPKRCRRPPLFGELHPWSTLFSDSRCLTLLVAPPCYRVPSPSSPAIVCRPSPRNVAAKAAFAASPVLRHLDVPHRPSSCLVPPPLHAGSHHVDQTTHRPTLRHRPPHHHIGPGRGDYAMGVRPQRRGHGPVGPFGHWARPVLPGRGSISAHALLIGFQFPKSFFLLKFSEIYLSF
jgi:hypothetical protein